jgi:type VI secretion system protein ImpF
MPIKGYTPGLFDRLLFDQGHDTGAVARLSVEEMKDAVARDLEALLNTRTVVREDLLKRFPECGRSIASYGLADFAGLSLSSTDDRAAICRALERAIVRHEPRLRNVQASLEVREGAINRLGFNISALLVASALLPACMARRAVPASQQLASTSKPSRCRAWNC